MSDNRVIRSATWRIDAPFRHDLATSYQIHCILYFGNIDPKTIRVDTYVDIATTLAWQPRPYGELRTNSKDAMAGGNSTSIGSLRQDWEKRIKRWQEEDPGRGTSITSTNLTHISIGTLFLQHPVPGWRFGIFCKHAMNSTVLYARVQTLSNSSYDGRSCLCCNIWTTLKLKNAGKNLSGRCGQQSRKRKTDRDLRFEKDGDRKKNRKRPGVEERVSAISYGVDNLEDLWYVLSESFQVSPDMKDAVDTKEILDAIGTSLVRKFSMISRALKDESSNAVTTDDSIQSISNLSTSMSFY
ncbi:hypothetical protein HYFRA_00012460 [Hymenoscyphus fraxineus]|uniref:Uncharacterized protein n=1 Tax=Hymenoscyphus fraxineus TaxID=746836 RepID=A0A9N9KZL2_9HELO|nr:hypothetical protein HYFRA_00012460 [Hymenoscyphus fraxineus]